MLMKNALFFLKILNFDYALENIDFSDNIGFYLYFLEYARPTSSLGYCFEVFRYVSAIHLWTSKDGKIAERT